MAKESKKNKKSGAKSKKNDNPSINLRHRDVSKEILKPVASDCEELNCNLLEDFDSGDRSDLVAEGGGDGKDVGNVQVQEWVTVTRRKKSRVNSTPASNAIATPTVTPLMASQDCEEGRTGHTHFQSLPRRSLLARTTTFGAVNGRTGEGTVPLGQSTMRANGAGIGEGNGRPAEAGNAPWSAALFGDICDEG